MGSDIFIVLQWWGTLFLVGAAAFPLTRRLFSSWYDQGYFFAKAVGMATIAWIVYAMGTVKVVPFSIPSIIVSSFLLFIGGIALTAISNKQKVIRKRKFFDLSLISSRLSLFFIEELFFFTALVFWSWIKGHEPSIRGLEKFMDYGFMQSILNSRYFPPADMWYPPFPINYYYFGHLVTAVVTKLSGLELSYTFNLMLATIFALTLTMSFSIGVQLSAISHQLSDSLKAESFKLKERHIGAGLLTAFLVTLGGNLQTIYAFTRGYVGEDVKPFWELVWKIGEIGRIGGIGEKLREGMERYWYANATRFIPYTIHEFPSYSFVVSDVHGHVLSIPFVLLAIAMLIQMAISNKQEAIRSTKSFFLSLISYRFSLVFYGFLVGVLLMTNALDGPIYLGLFLIILGIFNFRFSIRLRGESEASQTSEESEDPASAGFQPWDTEALGASIFNTEIRKQKIIIGVFVTIVAVITSLPFLSHFKSFVTGLAVNCPPAFLANTKIGPFIFEGVEKCQKSPLWMMYLLWGFFWFCGLWLIPSKVKGKWQKEKGNWLIGLQLNTKLTQVETILLIFFIFSVALVIFPEFFYFKDIYPVHFRSNTMFKLGYQAFILFSIVSGYTIVQVFFGGRASSNGGKSQIPNPKSQMVRQAHHPKFKFLSQRLIGLWPTISKMLFSIFLVPQLFLVSIYPIFSVRSYFGGLKNYEGIWGLRWLAREYPDDYSAMEWMKKATSDKQTTSHFPPFTLVEADGDSYTDYNRFSAFTGIPTIVGWAVHEWLWRGSYEVVAPRREEVRLIYESEDIEETREFLARYNVRYIVVGTHERQKFEDLQEWKFLKLGSEAFRSGDTVIYEVKPEV